MTRAAFRPVLAALATAVPLIAGLLALSIVISEFGSAGLVRTSTLALVNLTVVVGFYVFVGNSGIISFGHTGFVAVGAYAAAILTIPPILKQTRLTALPDFILTAQLGTPVAIAIGAALAAMLAWAVARPIARLDGLQAGIATLSVLVIVHEVVSNSPTVTGGQNVLVGVPLDVGIYGALACAAVAMVIAALYQHSSSGVRLRASREDPIAAQALGIDVEKERRRAIVLSGFVCALGGGVYGHVQGGFDPSAFYVAATTLFVVMLVVGGMRSLTGAVVGAVVVAALSELLRRAEGGVGVGALDAVIRPGFQQVALAVVFLAMLILRPRGLTRGRELSLLKASLRRRSPSTGR